MLFLSPLQPTTGEPKIGQERNRRKGDEHILRFLLLLFPPLLHSFAVRYDYLSLLLLSCKPILQCRPVLLHHKPTLPLRNHHRRAVRIPTHNPHTLTHIPTPPPPTLLQAAVLCSSITNSLPFSAIITVGLFVFPDVIRGITLVSHTLSPFTPLTLIRPSNTAIPSPPPPILHVPAGWKIVVPTLPAAIGGRGRRGRS